ncbi:MFS transporter [Dactylosporangium sp. CA-139114]|uniref:MFS transporter n=1 Tax=Dactylosporangium sp. CA-139114 TaxID=3239931 RepID=UPI003D95B402
MADTARTLAPPTTGAPPIRPRRLRWVLGAEMLVNGLGRFTLMPVLGVVLATQDPAAGPSVVGAGLLVHNAATGVSSVLVNRYLSRLRYNTALGLSMLLAAAGFGVLPYLHDAAALILALLVAGLGISAHTVLTPLLAADIIADDAGRNRMYSMFQIAGNAAAAVGPFLAAALYVSTDARPLLTLVGGAYLVAGLILYLGLPGRMHPAPTSGRWPISRGAFATAVRDPNSRRVVAITVIGMFVYAQFYSAFALFVAYVIESPALRSVLLALPAVAIVFVQAAVTGVSNRLLRAGRSPFLLLGVGSLLFGAAMLLLGAGLPLLVASFASVAVFAVAEMVFQPMLSTAFAALPMDSRLEAFGIRQLSWTIGSGAGSFVGGAVYLMCHHNHADHVYWLVLGAATLAGTALLMLGARRTA